MSAAPAESMEPPLEDVVGRGIVRGCSHRTLDLHGPPPESAGRSTSGGGWSSDVGRQVADVETDGTKDSDSWDSESACVQEKHQVKAESS